MNKNNTRSKHNNHRAIATIAHILSLAIFLSGVTMVFCNNNFKSGIFVANYQAYTDSPVFNGHFSEDIQSVFDYINYYETFVEEGIDTEYVDFAKSRGFYLDENNDVATLQKDPDKDDPSTEMIMEYLGNLGRYLKAKDRLFDNPTNFTFHASYGNKVFTNNKDLNINTAKISGKYAICKSGVAKVDTNLTSVPPALNYLSQTCVYNFDSAYTIIVCVNDDFTKDDVYRRENIEYERQREMYFNSLIVAIAGLVLTIGTLIWLISINLNSDYNNQELSNHSVDALPIEIRIILSFILAILLLVLNKYVISRFIHMILPIEFWTFVEKAVAYAMVYMCIVLLVFSAIRSYKRGTLASGSLIRKWADDITANIENRVESQKIIIYFITYLVISNVLLFGSALLINKGTTLIARLFAILLALLFVLLNIFVFYRIYKNALASDKEQLRSERLKTDLITNVSHDIKTPLTSIINYIDLIKREKPDNPKIIEYLQVLDQKSQHLKTLTDDLVEASKASSGNVNLDIQEIDFAEMTEQVNGEFEEKYSERGLSIVANIPSESCLIKADGNSLWRVLENLYSNAYKYASENSRVYVDMKKADGKVSFTIKNVSASQLNIKADELVERFVRGDVSRSTEGSGLGLSIARSLTEIQGGKFKIEIDGDLFKASVEFPSV